MPSYSFLILNYKNVDETFKCVESIQYANYRNTTIVIVDNGSTDGSYEKLLEKYKNAKNIFIVKSEVNLGFSGGNNLGYAFIRENLKPDFLVVANNDVLFPQKDMANRIQNIYKNTGFFILGPDIYVRKNREHQSPITLTMPSKDSIISELTMYKYYISNPKKWVTRRKIQGIKNRLCQSNICVNKIYCKIKKKNIIDYTKNHVGCCVQGACIIASKKYIDAEEKMFAPEPFLYCEELLLYKKCIDKGYLIVYDPTIQIWHEDSSTMSKINSSELQKAKFTLPHHVAALELLLECWD